jgi:hypothetical protein
VRFARAAGGQRNAGELTSPRRIPASAIRKVIRLRR